MLVYQRVNHQIWRAFPKIRLNLPGPRGRMNFVFDSIRPTCTGEMTWTVMTWKWCGHINHPNANIFTGKFQPQTSFNWQLVLAKTNTDIYTPNNHGILGRGKKPFKWDISKGTPSFHGLFTFYIFTSPVLDSSFKVIVVIVIANIIQVLKICNHYPWWLHCLHLFSTTFPYMFNGKLTIFMSIKPIL